MLADLQVTSWLFIATYAAFIFAIYRYLQLGGELVSVCTEYSAILRKRAADVKEFEKLRRECEAMRETVAQQRLEIDALTRELSRLELARL